MTKKLFWIALKFVAITGPVTWWWMYGGGQEAYWGIFRTLAFPILDLMGVTTFSPGLVKDRLLNFLPFVTLMLITPGLSSRRRYRGLAAGLVVIFLGQVLLAWWAWWTHTRSGNTSPQAMSAFFPALILTDALPFVVWAAVANKVLLEQLARIMPPALEPGAHRPVEAPPAADVEAASEAPALEVDAVDPERD